MENAKPVYTYSKGNDTPKWLWQGYYSGGNGMGYWFVSTSAFGYVISFLILTLGIALYWVLITIWASVYAFHTTKKASIGWMLIFLLAKENPDEEYIRTVWGIGFKMSDANLWFS